MVYEVRVIRDSDLPDGQVWALVQLRDRVVLLVKERAVGPAVLAEVWAGVRAIRDRRLLSIV